MTVEVTVQPRFARLGPIWLEFRLPLDTPGLDDSWCTASGGNPEIAFDVAADGHFSETAAQFGRFDDAGCALTIRKAAVTADFQSKRGRWSLAQPLDATRTRPQLDFALMASWLALVLRRGGLMVHSAAPVIDGAVCLVAGPSGAGKSTLAARMGTFLHDDFNYAVPTAHGWQVWRQQAVRGSPSPTRAWQMPLRGIFLLGPDRQRTAVAPLSPAHALAILAPQLYFAGGAAMARLGNAMQRLVTEVPAYLLSHCLADPPAALHEALRAAPPSRQQQAA